VSTIAQLCLLYFTSFRLQRYLMAAGVVVLVLALFIRPFSVPSASVTALLGAMLLLFPVLTTAGVVLRATSAPRTHRFLPYFRIKMLAAITLTIAIALVVTYALLWIFHWGGVFWQPVADTFWLTVLCVSVPVLSMFIVSGSPLNLLLTLPLSYALLVWTSQGAPTPWTNVGVNLSFAAATLCAIAWTVFGAWYLRVRQIAPIGWLRPLSGPDMLYSDPNGEVPRLSAVSIYLAGRKAWRPSYRLITIAGVAIAAVGILWAFERVRALEVSVSTFMSAPLTIMFFTYGRANQIAKRSRSLWLRSAELRGGVFRVCEMEALRDFLWNAALAALLIGGFALLLPTTQWSVLSWTLMLCLVTGLFVMYLGLMYVRGLRALDITAATLLVLSAFVAVGAIATTPIRPYIVVGVLGFQIVGALTARTVALQRWQRIDWLRLRPARMASQALRTG
jgi:hypothetical protein